MQGLALEYCPRAASAAERYEVRSTLKCVQ